MKEKIYTIPVNEAFDKNEECPFCTLFDSLEKDAIDFVLGSSYMEDDIRAETDKIGFCSTHIKKLYSEENRLGLALILHTHMQKVQKDLQNITSKSTVTKKSIFSSTNTSNNPTLKYINSLNESCYICNSINKYMGYYIDTFFYLWKKDISFKNKFTSSKGICTKHFGEIYELCQSKLSNKELTEFIPLLNNLYFTQIERVTNDLDWFIQKFDYRNNDAPWKESKDAIIRSIVKTNNTKVTT